jgi:hypothetical protein
LVWTILLRLVGRPHPPTLDDFEPVGRARIIVGVVTLGVFLLCFMPRPVQISWSDLLPTSFTSLFALLVT